MQFVNFVISFYKFKAKTNVIFKDFTLIAIFNQCKEYFINDTIRINLISYWFFLYVIIIKSLALRVYNDLLEYFGEINSIQHIKAFKRDQMNILLKINIKKDQGSKYYISIIIN